VPQPASETHSDAWRRCAPGELADLGACHRQQKSLRRWLVNGAATMVVLLCVTAPALVYQHSGHGHGVHLALDCLKCRELMQKYIAGGLDRTSAVQMETHLEHCDHCKQEYERLRRGSSESEERDRRIVLSLISP